MRINTGDMGVDCASNTRAKTAAAKTAGYQFMVRYDSPNPANPKNLTRAEAEMIIDEFGLGLLVVFEGNERDYLGGATGGARNGLIHRAHMAALGYPDDICSLVACDTDITDMTVAIAQAYVHGFYSTSGRPNGPYGDDDIIVAAPGVINWLANASGWSHGKAGALMTVRQRRTDQANGWDPNVAVQPFDVWGPTPAPPVVEKPTTPIVVTTPPTPAPIQEEPMATVIVTAPTPAAGLGKQYNASFITQAPLDPDGNPIILSVFWPHGPEGEQLLELHKQNPATIQREYDLSFFKAWFVNEVPSGDDQRPNWSAADFGGVG